MSDENRNGVIETDFGDGRQRFRLAFGELEELQEKTGIGPYALWKRLIDQEWHIADVREPIRLGLIGGGMKPSDALSLVRRYVDERPDWIANSILAKLVVLAAIAGAPEEEPGKDAPPEAMTEAPLSPTDALLSADGTAPPELSVSPSPTSAA